MKIILTGGNGFIGKSLIYKLKEHDIISIDKKIDTTFNGNQIISDLCYNDKCIEDEIKKCDLVIHLASPVGVKNIDINADIFLEELLKINLNIFNLVKKYNKKIIFLSTSEVYLNNADAKESDILNIGVPDKLRWGYASGKLTSEFLCKSLCKKSIIIRPFNITGVGDNKGVLYKIIESIKNEENIIVHGNGNQIRSFCDIRDFENFISLIIKNNFDGSIYNVGNENNKLSIKELSHLCTKIANSKMNILFKKYNDIYSDNFDDIQVRVPNCVKMNKIYKAKYNMENIIKSML